jgi:glycerol-3-phosphate dehydrogenase
MQRTLDVLAREEFDVLIIGAGAFGAAAAWDASLRGLRVALIEQRDFGAGASAECFKFVHGGIRYLQHANIRRLRSSCRERSALLRIAPHLVRPIPIVLPTFGAGRNGKAFLGAGMMVYDLLTAGRNDRIRDPTRRIAPARFLSRTGLLALFPELEQPRLTGAAVFEDGQMYSPPRLVLAFVESAFRRGACVANYVQAGDFLWEGSRVRGVRARDVLGGDEFDIRARLVLNAAGPWAEYLLGDRQRFGEHRRGNFSRDACFILRRKPRSGYALAVPGQSRDRDSLVSREGRHMFVVPWRDFTLIGVWHRLFAERPDRAMVEEQELEAWIAEMNASCPALQLRRDEVSYANWGLVPFGEAAAGANELSFGKESRFIDHRQAHGIGGLVTLIGIRYTTARGDAAAALDMLLQQWTGAKPGRSATANTPLVGGDMADLAAFQTSLGRQRSSSIPDRSFDALVCNHGTEAAALLRRAAEPGQSVTVGGSDTLVAEVTHAVEAEMAVHLEDVVLRRTDLGSGAHPGRAALEGAADAMGGALGWTGEQRARELAATTRVLALHHALEAS